MQPLMEIIHDIVISVYNLKMGKFLLRKTPVTFSVVEKGWLEKSFSSFLLDIEGHGANVSSLDALSTVIEVSNQNKNDPEINRTISERIADAGKNLLPANFTLEEAAALYEVNAATLRRACWSGRLKATKRGKTWFVCIEDLEQYLFRPEKTRG